MRIQFAAMGLMCAGCQCLAPVNDAMKTTDGGRLGPTDAGVVAGSAEICDGIDNDLDGFVDRLPGGELLGRPCALTAGVCAQASSLCIDGGYAACDYGAHYELVERPS